MRMTRIKRPQRSWNPWTPASLKILKKSAGKVRVKKIAKLVGHSEGATRQKAFSLAISLDTRKAA